MFTVRRIVSPTSGGPDAPSSVRGRLIQCRQPGSGLHSNRARSESRAWHRSPPTLVRCSRSIHQKGGTIGPPVQQPPQFGCPGHHIPAIARTVYATTVVGLVDRRSCEDPRSPESRLDRPPIGLASGWTHRSCRECASDRGAMMLQIEASCRPSGKNRPRRLPGSVWTGTISISICAGYSADRCFKPMATHPHRQLDKADLAYDLPGIVNRHYTGRATRTVPGCS